MYLLQVITFPLTVWIDWKNAFSNHSLEKQKESKPEFAISLNNNLTND